MNKTTPKIAVIGAGPSGATASLFLSKYKIPHVIFEKEIFPRDKVCGDGMTIEVYRTLAEISPDLATEFVNLPFVEPAKGAFFLNAEGKGFNMSLEFPNEEFDYVFVAKRKHFDNWLFNKAKASKYCLVREGVSVKNIERIDDQIQLFFGDESEVFNLVLGCDGERSIVKKLLFEGGVKKKRKNHAGALRAYYKNVPPMYPGKPLEIYITKRFKFGYFWIFHLPNNECNVGIGGLSEEVSKSKVNLKKEFYHYIDSVPHLKKRFNKATELEPLKGWGIPLNTLRQDYYDNGVLIFGDAAHMAEPATGKGIGVSMFAIYYAMNTILKAVETNDFSKENLKDFQKNMERVFYKEWDKLKYAQKTLGYPWLVNIIARIMSVKFVQKAIDKKTQKAVVKFMKPKGLISKN